MNVHVLNFPSHFEIVDVVIYRSGPGEAQVKPQQYMMQVFLQLPNGQTMPVHIPASVAVATAAAVPTTTVAAQVQQQVATAAPTSTTPHQSSSAPTTTTTVTSSISTTSTTTKQVSVTMLYSLVIGKHLW